MHLQLQDQGLLLCVQVLLTQPILTNVLPHLIQPQLANPEPAVILISQVPLLIQDALLINQVVNQMEQVVLMEIWLAHHIPQQLVLTL